MQVANYIQGVVQLYDMSQTFNIHSIIKTQFYQRRKTIRVITVWGGGGGGGGESAPTGILAILKSAYTI